MHLGCPNRQIEQRLEDKEGCATSFNAFVERHDVAWELGMALLAVLYVGVGFALDDQRSGDHPPMTNSVVDRSTSIASRATWRSIDSDSVPRSTRQ